MVARKLVSTCRYIVQTVTQSGIRASVFLWAGNVKGGEERGLASTRISSSMRESEEEGTEYSGGLRQVIKLRIFPSSLRAVVFSRPLLAEYLPSGDPSLQLSLSLSLFPAPCPSLISRVSFYCGH